MTEQLDVITLTGLSAVGQHGVFEFERNGSQVFTADIELAVDTRTAAAHDDVAYTVDYSQISDGAIQILTGPPVFLIETLAQRLADMALSHSLVRRVKVTVHKPMAPLGHVVQDVAVTIERDRNTVIPTARETLSEPAQVAHKVSPPQPSEPVLASFEPADVAADPAVVQEQTVVLSLGSNLGDSHQILSNAVAALMEVWGFEIDDVSPLVVTKAVLLPGQDPQPNYVNAVVIGRTVLDPLELLEATSSIERQLGRDRSERWGARTIDIDLIDVGGQQLNHRDLQLPHPRAHERAFVLYPWHLIDKRARLNPGGLVAELLLTAPDQDGILDVFDDWLVEPGEPDVYADAYGNSPLNEAAHEAPASEVVEAVDPVAVEPVAAPSRASIFEPSRYTNGAAPEADDGQSRDDSAGFQKLLDAELHSRQVKTTADGGGGDTSRSAGAPRHIPPYAPPNPALSAWAPQPETVTTPDSSEASPQEEAAEAAPQNGSFGRVTPAGSEFPTAPPSIVPRRSREAVRPNPAHEPEPLPDWRFATEPQSVRIVDTPVVAEDEAEQSEGASRRRVIRPTPTGMHPVTPPTTDR